MWGYFLFCLLSAGWVTSEAIPERSFHEGHEVDAKPTVLKETSGVESHLEDSPYQATFKVDNTYYCGGFIIGERDIIAPAHCTYGVSPEQVLLRAGSSYLDEGGIIIPISKIVTHPGYNDPIYDKDVAYMITAEPIVFSKTIKPIALPPRDRPLKGEIVVSGMESRRGEVTTVPSRVMKTLARIMDDMHCRVAHPTVMTRNKACSTNFFSSQSNCQQDAEGIAVQDGMAVALMSFSGACGQDRSPSIFADLAAPEIRDFLTEHLGF